MAAGRIRPLRYPRPKSRRPFRTGSNRCRPALEPLEAYTLLSNTYPVQLATDDGLGDVAHTLSWAIVQVNNDATDSSASPDTISFDIGGGGARTIAPTAALPALSKPALIDGTSQPGFTAANSPLIEISGGALTGTAVGLTLAAGSGGSKLQALAISGFNGDGIDVLSNGNTIGEAAARAGDVITGNQGTGVHLNSGASDNTLLGNFIGTNAAGATGLGNGFNGVVIEGGASGNTVGGAATGDANTIAGNADRGVVVDSPLFGQPGAKSMNNVVLGNFIGTDAHDHTGLGNVGDGLAIFDSSIGNTIGGAASGDANTIASNGGNGVTIQGPGASNNQVLGNYVGTDAAGATGLGNDDFGVDIESATGNTVGGAATGDANTIASSARGVNIFGEGTGALQASGNVISGNFIGTDAAGAFGLGNTFDGVGIDTATSDTVVGNTIEDNTDDGVIIYDGATGNTIGGTAAGDANTIAANTLTGVLITDTGTSDNQVVGNFIGTNSAGATNLGYESSGVVITATASDDTIEANTIEDNASMGVEIEDGATGNTIGGTAAGAANIIAANAIGVVISSPNGGGTTSANQVLGNFIGTDARGDTGMGNRFDGVRFTGDDATGDEAGGNTIEDNGNYGVQIEAGASGNTIGGTTAALANTIAANGTGGVFINGLIGGPGASDNQVLGNFIGTDARGDTGMGNRYDGVFIEYATGNTIGGSASGAGNTIAANTTGVDLLGGTKNAVLGNFIGTDSDMQPGLGNDGGVFLDQGSSNNTIGGAAAGAGNTIADNSAAGVAMFGISDEPASNNAVLGNFIGTNSLGNAGLGNGGDGVSMGGFALNNTIGGTAAGAGNLIANNTGNGVTVGLEATDFATGDAILDDLIWGNGHLGIDLGDDGVTPNDSEGHAGPNLLQDSPVLTTASTGAGGLTTITGTVEGPASSTVTVELFTNPTADPSGYGQGRTLLGTVAVPISAAGSGLFSFIAATPISTGSAISATATDSHGNTSEFSRDLATTAVSDNVTDDFLIDQGPFIYYRAQKTYEQKVTITGLVGIGDFIYLELVNLPLAVKLTGTSNVYGVIYSTSADPPAGSPMVLMATQELSRGQTASITLYFNSVGNVQPSYTAVLLNKPSPFTTSLAVHVVERSIGAIGVPSPGAIDGVPQVPSKPAVTPTSFASEAVAARPRAGLRRVWTPIRREPAQFRLFSPKPSSPNQPMTRRREGGLIP